MPIQTEESTSPYLSENCPNLYSSFFARHLRRASVAWLNSRYWSAEGWDLSDCGAVRELKKLIVDRFGVSTFSELDGEDAYLDTGVTLYADRYGGTFGHSHGGSGRAGTFGNLNAKGIGATPLRDPKANWYHSHGCMWLEEAVREAIYSEVCWYEFPWRSNPIVAIIDTGEHAQWRDGTRGARRAIAVRPAALRVAHLERNILFGTAGTVESDQYKDTLRVKEIISHVSRLGIELDRNTSSPVLASMVNRICDQIGYGRAHRLFHGDYLSSNICITGALIDFGAFRGVEDWQRREWEDDGLPFGGEDRRLFQTARSLAFHLRKHTGVPFDNNMVPLEDITATIHSAFVKSLARLCLGHTRTDAIVSRIVEYYEINQQRSPSLSSTWSSFHAGIVGKESDESHPEDFAIGKSIYEQVIDCSDDIIKGRVIASISRWATSRCDTTREAVLSRTTAMIETLEASESIERTAFSEHVSSFIDDTICDLRRSFSTLNDHEVIVKHSTFAGCLSLHCRDLLTGNDYWRIEGSSVDGALIAAGERIYPWVGCERYDLGPGRIGFTSKSDSSNYVSH